jgi:hypothetical protein
MVKVVSKQGAVEPAPALIDEVCPRRGNIRLCPGTAYVFKVPHHAFLADNAKADDAIISTVAVGLKGFKADLCVVFRRVADK